MRRLKSCIGLMLALLLCARLSATELRKRPDLAWAFEAEGLPGTFVLRDLTVDTLFVTNATRAKQQFVPASTFKIPNTLIGLRTGAVRDVDEVLPFGGGKHPVAAWEQDMSLRQAIPVSNVPIYQELARRIGLAHMAASVTAFAYGNREIGSVVDRFWLDGPLKISAVEQTEFLARLVQRKLPVEEKFIEAVEEITLLERTDSYRLHGKTGWQPPIGWWVGWIERDGEISTFALNVDLVQESDAPKRIKIGKACLRALGKLD